MLQRALEGKTDDGAGLGVISLNGQLNGRLLKGMTKVNEWLVMKVLTIKI